jgi:hypothetical protein
MAEGWRALLLYAADLANYFVLAGAARFVETPASMQTRGILISYAPFHFLPRALPGFETHPAAGGTVKLE